MNDEPRKELDSDAENVVRRGVGSWDDVAFIMTGTTDAVEGDGLTQTASSLQPGDGAVLEIVHEGETVARFVSNTDAEADDE